ncbi:beta strand repeat-containing protein [Halorubrum sp. N11]|uniref:beta strand repeat-containing protein n=1 Tax=Halorubrum sp. N11 TaxID=3402276 RepID=UPI003EB8E163
MPDTRVTPIALACLILVGFTLAPAGVAAATPADAVTADVEPDASLSAAYYGDVSVNGAEPGESLEVVAYADLNGDGERTAVDSLVAGTNGAFGDATLDGEKIEVPEPADGQVQFIVGGVIANITSVDGQSVNAQTVAWNDGNQDVQLEVDEEALTGEPNFEINITDAPASIGEGDPVDVEATIENTGNATGTQSVGLSVDQGVGEVAAVSRTITPNSTETIQLSWDTAIGDAGDRALTVASEDDSESTVVTVEQAEATVDFADQATASSSTQNGPADAGVQVGLDTNVNGEVLLTYENGAGDLVVAGTTPFEPGDESAVVPVQDAGGFPGAHTVHTVRTNDTSADYAPGETISSATADSIIDSAPATVFQGTVAIDNQEYNDSTTEVVVSTSDLQPATAANYTVVVHEETEGLPVLGSSAELSGPQNDVTVSINEVDADTDMVAMLHFADSGEPVPNVDATAGVVAGGVSDTATVTINDSPFFNVTNPRPTDATIAAGSELFLSAETKNEGDFAETQNLTVTVTNETDSIVFEEKQELTLPANSDSVFNGSSVTFTEAGNYTYTIASNDTSVSGSVTVVSEATGNITLNEQATNSSLAFFAEGDDLPAGIVAEDVEANVDSYVFATYEDDGNTTVAGWWSFSASELDGTETAIPLFENVTSVPNDITVHIVPDTDLSDKTGENVFESDPPVGQISAATADSSIANDTATVFEGTVELDDTDTVGNTTEVTLSDATLRDGADNTTDFAAVVYTLEFVDGNETLTPVGTSAILNGSNENVAVELDEPISERGTTDLVTVLHATDGNGNVTGPIPYGAEFGFITEIGDPALIGVSDNATATVREPANFEIQATQPTKNGTVAAGDIGAAALIQNTGDVNATQDVNFTIQNASGTEVAADTVSLTLNASEPVGQPGEAKPAFANIDINEAGEYTSTVETANDTDTVSFTVIDETAAGNVSVNDQAVSSSTVVDNPANPGIVVESVDANVDSGIFVFDANGDSVGGTSIQAGELDGSSKTVPLNDRSVPGDHTIYVVPSSKAPTVNNESDAASASIATDTVTLFDGTVTFADQTFIQQNISAVNVSTADLRTGTSTDEPFVVVVHPYDASTGTIGAPIGSSGNLTGANSNVEVTFNEPVSADGEYIAMLHEATGDGFGSAIAHGTADGFITSGVTDDATITIDQPATADLSNLNIAGAGTDASIDEGEQTYVAVDVENLGDLQGTFDVTLTIDNTEVETRSVTLNGSGIQTESFSDVTGNLDAGVYDVTVDANGTSIEGTLTVNEVSTSSGGGGGGGPLSSPAPAFFEVSNLEPVEATINEGETIDGSATITNTGEQAAQQTVEFRVDDQVIAEESVLLRSNGGEATLTLEDIDTSNLDAGEYTYGIYTQNDSQTGTLTVEAVDDGGSGDGGTDDGGTDDGGADDGGADDGGADDGGADDGGTDDGGSEDGTPGFGVLVALLAITLAAGFLTRRE